MIVTLNPSSAYKHLSALIMEAKAAAGGHEASGASQPGFKLLLRDFNSELVEAWRDKEAFGDAKFQGLVEVTSFRLTVRTCCA